MPNYIVDPLNGADPNSGLTESTAWRTPYKARTTARPSDNVLFRGGDYAFNDNNACLRTGYHGLPGVPITFKAYPGEIPTFRNQPTGLVFEHNYISIIGLKFLNDAMRSGQFVFGISAGANHHLVLEDCEIGNCSPGEPTWAVNWPDVSYGRISRCRIHHVGTPPQPGPESGNGLGVAGDHNLIEDTIVDFCGHAGAFFCGDHNILRRSEFIGTWGVPGENLRQISHPGRNLVEWCIFRGASFLQDGMWANPNWQQMGSNMVLRFSLIYDGNGAMIMIYSRPDYPSKGCRLYHNVGYHNGYGSPYPPGVYELNEDQNVEGTQGDNIVKNSIHFKNKRDRASFAGLATAADIAFLSNTWNETDPLFVDEVARNFRLREGSPCINAGEFLTRTRTAGSGQTIPVQDSLYFCDGWGIVEGDYIQLEGTSEAVQIASIDYANHNINVKESVSWQAGQGVSLPFVGSRPDIGAFEYIGGTMPTASINIILEILGIPGITVTATPTSRSIQKGQSTTYQLAVAAVDGYAGAVAFAVAGLPAGVTAAFSPVSITPGQSTTLTITTQVNSPVGTVTLTVTATGA